MSLTFTDTSPPINFNDPIIQKLNTELTFDQKEIFIQQFYGYLAYDEEKDFIVDLDKVYEWLGFTRKDHAKRLLVKHFTLDEDYKTLLPPRGEQNPEENRGGHNQEKILMTVATLKTMGMLAKTEQGKNFRKYYLAMERIINQQLKESTDEATRRFVAIEKEKMLMEKHKGKSGVYFIKCFLSNVVKFGSSVNVTKRVKDHKNDFGKDKVYLDKVIETIHYSQAEKTARPLSNDTFTDEK